MSAREVHSFDLIKEKLTISFFDNDPTIRKLTCNIMSKMLILWGYYSWAELVDFFLVNLKKAEKLIQQEDNSPGGDEEVIQKELSIAENSIEAISAFVEKYSKSLDDETYKYQIDKIVHTVFRLLDPRQSAVIKEYALIIINILILT